MTTLPTFPAYVCHSDWQAAEDVESLVDTGFMNGMFFLFGSALWADRTFAHYFHVNSPYYVAGRDAGIRFTRFCTSRLVANGSDTV
jgi:hypothetical protein